MEAGLYLYGITVAQGTVPVEVPGIENAEVEQVVEGSLAAIVTRVTTQKIRPQRSNLAAHHHVLRDLTEQQPILPAAFGTIAGSEKQLREVLRRNHDVLIEQLKRLRGKVEMGLGVYWDTPNVFEFFVATHRELEQMRDRLFRPGKTPRFEEKVELGKLFESLLRDSRQRHTRQVIEALSPYCVEIRTIDPGEEKMIMKLACLVEESRRGQWEDGIEAVARHFDNHYGFKYTGPWAPHNFADIDLNLVPA
ncbi:MAG: hypothetical protein A2V70_02740 [Planctomycetes bacterium RBG_13_63_9]|nr:MAG: hypothetical protein A2V70_02740 [Planctomycetes bacterium RBG_13_63_9]